MHMASGANGSTEMREKVEEKEVRPDGVACVSIESSQRPWRASVMQSCMASQHMTAEGNARYSEGGVVQGCSLLSQPTHICDAVLLDLQT
jgi:hypothetical protein